MTRTFNEKVRCQDCGHEQTAESDFERWMRNCQELDSKSEGIVRFDLDILLHKYKNVQDKKGDRTIQCMMFVEVKTRMAQPSDSQRDTLSLLNNVMRNRVQNMHSSPRKQMGGQPRKVYSQQSKSEVALFLFGGHLLRIDGTSPTNSKKMLWDNKEVNLLQLVELLRFDRDPDNPSKMLDIRRRSRPFAKMPLLFDLSKVE
jgi:hypothetical protein